ncbi:3-hydroxyisobutyrate dehydrogenase [Actinopolyspora biskrensis]|uniref:3-hydroxyisobutyrate dehydrogenase n=1 Tax=Actinopolyspora biskrensis TaxID=1470178 RepID=A0A852YZD5_9ACTN|nr:NAD(P)-dependent oxidoreductase [Actinopolyspora biskrensis]NYH78365.1 3-hydroxyisobutyrate dehydrogenase [Actinopolyspora biskrensis]
MTTVAFLGTGAMGAPMASNLLGAGFDVRVWNRTQDRAAPLRTEGAVVADTPAEAAHNADVLVTMLLDAEATVRAGSEAVEALGPGSVWVQMGTIGLEGMDRVRQFAQGVALVDAPVLGTRSPAEQGTLTVLAAADPEVRPAVQPMLDTVGQRTMWVGEDATLASGTRLKLAVNSWVLTLTNAVGESLALSQHLGLDPNLFLEAIDGTATDSPYAHLKGAAILNDRLAPSFTVHGAGKDASLVREAAGDSLRLDLIRAAGERFRRAEEAGYANSDMAAAYFASFAPGTSTEPE